MANVNWWLDFREFYVDSDEVRHDNIFWIGPFSYVPGTTMSVQKFVDDINEKLAAAVTTDPNNLFTGDVCTSAFPHGATPILYQVTPHLRLVGSTSHDLGYSDNQTDVSPTIMSQLLADTIAQATADPTTGNFNLLQTYQEIISSWLGGNDRFVIRYDVNIVDHGIANSSALNEGTLFNTEIRANHGMHGSSTPATAGMDDGSGCPGSDSGEIQSPPYSQVYYTNIASPALTLVPSSAAATIMLDNPPLPPNLSIFPYMGVNNRLLFMFTSNTGKYIARPEILTTTDANAISDLFLHQYGLYIPPDDVTENIDSGILKILYENDDPIGEYELYRLETRPTSYSDYIAGNNPHKVVDSHVFVNKDSSAASYIDEIVPNKKYYYCARAIDVHNNFSNPTHVFEVELVDNDGQTYLILNTIMLGTEAPRSPTKAGRRYLYIEPALGNLGVDQGQLENDYGTATETTIPAQELLGDGLNTSTGAGGNPTALDGPVWEKTFKVRLTSKKTYKKIDLNITFKNTGVINP